MKKQTLSRDYGIWKNLMKLFKNKLGYVILLMVFISLAGILEASAPLAVRYFIDNFIIPKKIVGLQQPLILLIFVILAASLSTFIYMIAGGVLEYRLSYELRNRAFIKLQNLNLEYFVKNPQGNIISRITSDITKLGEVISWGIVDFTHSIILAIFSISAMILINFKLSLIAFGIIPVILVIVNFFQKKILKQQRKTRMYNSNIVNAFNENIVGIKTSKSLGIEGENCSEFYFLSSAMKRASIKSSIFTAIFMFLVMFFASVAASLSLHFSTVMVMNETMSYGSFIAFFTYTIQLLEPLRIISQIISDMKSAQAASERVFSLLSEEIKIKDKEDVIMLYGDLFNPKKENYPDMTGSVEFKNVNFYYNKNEPLLKNFSLKVNAGQTVAIVGPTGAGKSTIVNLLCRFYEPVEGEILIDGKDYREYSMGYLHENLGYVLQTPQLFEGSIADNIRYGKENASFEEIVNAAKTVGAHDFIADLEKGYNTWIGGTDGISLSTGEKQLLSFARAIIRKPKIFVLDEATSSIDTEMERTVQKATDKVLKGNTGFVIAHRLSTITDADIIILVESGKIVETGNHKELMEKRGKYYELYSNRFLNIE